MKRLFWCLKAGFLCVALLVLLGGYTSGVVAQGDPFDLESGGACASSFPCTISSTSQCYCSKGLDGNGNCNGCYITNGADGCGVCVHR